MATIIIEGMDNTGKTTLAKELADRLGYTYVSGGGPEVGTFKGALSRMRLAMPNKVQDRTWISELVYGPIVRGKFGITDEEVMEFIRFHREYNIVLIYARRPLERILETLHEREQMDGVIKYASELVSRYDYYMLEKLPIYLPLPVCYNFETSTIDKLIESLQYSGQIKELG